MALPWHSVDATNWELGPCKFGNWKSFGNMSVRGSKQNLRAEVEWYLELERLAQHRWRITMEKLERELPPWPPAASGPTVRLAADCGSASGQRMDSTLGPTVMLAAANAGSTRTGSTSGPSMRLALTIKGDAHIKESGFVSRSSPGTSVRLAAQLNGRAQIKRSGLVDPNRD